LNSNKYMYSTYIDNRTYVITSPDKTKIDLLKNTLYHHKTRTNKWLNKGVSLKLGDRNNTLDIMENNAKTVTEEDILLEVTYVSINESNDVMFLNKLYELANVQLFLMYDYEYLPNSSLLSIHGILIEKPNEEKLFEYHDFLNTTMNLDL
jgi:hypothetical protein